MPIQFDLTKPNFTSVPRGGSFCMGAVLLGLIAGSVTLGFAQLPEEPTSPTDPVQSRGRSLLMPSAAVSTTAETDLVQAVAGVKGGETVVIDLPAEPGTAFEVTVESIALDGGLPVTFELWPHSVRAQGFVVHAQVDDGTFIQVEPETERNLRGRITELPGSKLAGSLLESGLHGRIILPDGAEYWLEPVDHADAEPGSHILYSADDVEPAGVCGVDDHIAVPEEEQSTQGGVAGGLECVEMAIDADFQYYQQHGSSVDNVVNAVTNIVNTANLQYEEEVGIRHLITEIIVRTSSGTNPYSTSSASGLLEQFQDTWNTAPEWWIDRDIAHLFTGRNLSGSTIGIAYLNTICNKWQAYGLSQNMTSFAAKTDLFAHEVGHNWNASHCSCQNTTMHPSLQGANTFIGSGSNSVNQITNKLNNVSCPEQCIIPPANDSCASGPNAFVGETPFSNIDASTDGPEEPICNFSNNTNIQADVWFRHTATCTGTLHVELCDTQPAYDSKLAVYPIVCPTSPGTALACNKDACGHLSAVDVPVVAGTVYRIRIGGHNGAQGEGIVSISCTPDVVPNPCPADLTGDESVGVPDLLELLGSWGSCDDCDADLTGDGSVGVPDLLELLGAWGACS